MKFFCILGFPGQRQTPGGHQDRWLLASWALAGLVGGCLALVSAGVSSAVVPPSLDPWSGSHALEAGWQFQAGDDPGWADPATSLPEAQPIEVPGAWGRQGHADVEVAWYRITLRLEDPHNLRDTVPLGLTVGNVSTGYELFANGQRLGGVAGPPPDMAYDRHRTYPLPVDLLTRADGPLATTLTLAVRIWRHPAVGQRSGGLRQPPRIGPLAELVRQKTTQELPKGILVVLFAAVGIQHLLLYARRPGRKAYLWYGLFVLATAVYTLLKLQFRFLLSDDYLLLKELEYLAKFTVPALVIQFLWTHLQQPIGPWLRAYQLSQPALGIVAASTPGIELNLALFSFWLPWVSLTFVAALPLLLRRAVSGDRRARTILVGTLVLGATFGYDLLAGNNLVPQVYTVTYGLTVLVLSMAFSLANRFERVHRQLDVLNSDLERQVERRTQELAAAKNAAEAANETKTTFLTNISHEVRTPLNGIQGILELMRHHELPSDTRHYLGLLEDSTRTLVRVVDDMLDFSHIEAGELSFEARDFEISPVVMSVVDLFEPQAQAKNLDVRVHLGPEVPSTLYGDPERLRQVLFHLVDNAIKFTETGGVVVEVAPVKPDTPYHLLFLVSDTGIGIAEEQREALFLPFSQADGSTTRRHGGTGLGLAISRRIVEQAGGTLDFEARAEGGTTFVVTVPFATPSAP